MKCLMYGLSCDEEQFNAFISKNKSPYSVAHYLFETEMIKEMEKEYDIHHNYIFQENNKNLKECKIKSHNKQITEKTKTQYLGFINLPVLKYVTLFITSFFRTLFFGLKNKNDFFVLSTINYFPVAIGTQLATKILRVPNVVIFTDCSVGYAYDNNNGNSLKRQLKKLYKKTISSIEQKYDAYIFFSKPMNTLINKNNRPYIVMEGFFNTNNLDLKDEKKFDKFTILYAGTINNTIGLDNLLDAIQSLNDDLDVLIYGEGDYKKTLVKKYKHDKRIKFFDFISHEEIFKLEKEVSLLVNTRDPRLDYTKYSFPSKTFEYMASGTPFLSTKLQCYTEEYNDYIYFIKDNEPATIANKINEIFNLNEKDRNAFGLEAKKFILNKKTSKYQVSKIIDFINKELTI